MAFHIEITEPAQAEYEGIIACIKNENPVAAEKFSAKLLWRLELLGQQPRSGALYKRRPGIEIRQTVCRPYRILYRVRPRLRIVEILSIWHGARQEPTLRLSRRTDH
jgi:plasmid stabilization system protein ParE